jgi:hypothetical protein
MLLSYPRKAGIQYAVNSRMIKTVSEYWIIRFRG